MESDKPDGSLGYTCDLRAFTDFSKTQSPYLENGIVGVPDL